MFPNRGKVRGGKREVEEGGEIGDGASTKMLQVDHCHSVRAFRGGGLCTPDRIYSIFVSDGFEFRIQLLFPYLAQDLPGGA